MFFVISFLEINDVAWPGLEETAGSPSGTHHVGAVCSLYLWFIETVLLCFRICIGFTGCQCEKRNGHLVVSRETKGCELRKLDACFPYLHSIHCASRDKKMNFGYLSFMEIL